MLDPLSEVLRSVRLTGGVFLDVRLTAPWCVISELTAEHCRPFLAKPARLISYHVNLAGEFLLWVEGEPVMQVGAGEIVLLPRNDVQTLASAPGLAPVHGGSLVQPSPVREGTSRDWIEASVRFAAYELAEGRLASSSVMSRLSEVLLVEAVRHYAATLPDNEVGWLRGLRDPHVGRALALIHNDLRTPWSAEALAREVALSRSAFMDRFATLVGTPPMRYLTAWRLQSAKLQLRETRKSVGQLAHAVGYESEEAFSRAFKREFGLSPARWRDRVQSG